MKTWHWKRVSSVDNCLDHKWIDLYLFFTFLIWFKKGPTHHEEQFALTREGWQPLGPGSRSTWSLLFPQLFPASGLGFNGKGCHLWIWEQLISRINFLNLKDPENVSQVFSIFGKTRWVGLFKKKFFCQIDIKRNAQNCLKFLSSELCPSPPEAPGVCAFYMNTCSCTAFFQTPLILQGPFRCRFEPQKWLGWSDWWTHLVVKDEVPLELDLLSQSTSFLQDLKHVLVILSLNCVLFVFLFSVLVCAFIFVLYFKFEREFKALHNHLCLKYNKI